MPEIVRLFNYLNSSHRLDHSKLLLLQLHSVLTTQDQSLVFNRAPRGKRKVVLSTNIAETGVTIPDCVYVIDSGKAKYNFYNEGTHTSSLREVFISQ